MRFCSEIEQVSFALNASSKDRNVDGYIPKFDRGFERCALGLVGSHIALQKLRLVAGRTYIASSGFTGLSLLVHNGDQCAVRTDGFGTGESDYASTSSDQTQPFFELRWDQKVS